MTPTPSALLALIAPTAFLVAGLVGLARPGPRPRLVGGLSLAAAGLACAVALLAALLVARHGSMQSPLLGRAGLGFALRLDPLSVIIFAMISLLAFLILRFSRTYLDGDARQGAFLGWLCATIACVELLVLSGNLVQLVVCWVATSLSLHRLLVFYPERRAGIIAARKKFLAARVGDACLIGGALLLVRHFGTGDLGLLFTDLAARPTGLAPAGVIEAAAVLIASAAMLKSAQFPTHSWLIEVMETPTPVSALLHAGILNAGPFLAVRLSPVFAGTSLAPAVLIAIGGFTALFASTSLLTQSSIKTGLGYSSAAHMGFMLMICGLGVYSAAILHLVAHSFYKAHAFLSSGSVIETRRAATIDLPRRLGSPWRVALSVVAAVGVFLLFAALLHLAEGTLPVGIILVMGLAQIIAPTLDSDGTMAAVARSLGLGSLVATAFFLLEHGFAAVLRPVLPIVTHRPAAVSEAIWLVVALFGLTTLFQLIRPGLAQPAWSRRLALHCRNGLYANAAFDRLVGALRLAPNAPAPARD